MYYALISHSNKYGRNGAEGNEKKAVSSKLLL